MAIELAAVYVPIIPSLKGAPAAIQKELGLTDTRKVGTTIGSKLGNHIGSGLKSVATGTVATAAAGIGTALVKGFSRLNALDQANQKLAGLGHSAQSVEKIMSNALASVKGTAFGMDAAATVAASAVAAGIKPGKDLERTLSLVADAATIAGTDMGSMGAIFNKVAASNKVQMDVINQLHDAGVPALASLADYMGVTAEEASKMASRGEIDFATFQAAMEQTLGGAAQSSGSTFSGAMANVLASLGRVGAGILGGIFPKLAPLFQSATTALGPLEDKAAQIGAVIGDKVAPVLDWLTDALSGSLGQFKVAPQILGPAAAAFVALGSGGLAPLLGMVPGLGGLATKLTLLGSPVGIAVAAFAGLVAVSPELRAALGGLMQALTTAAAALAPSLSDVASSLGGALVTAIQIAVPIVTAIADALSWLLSDIIAPNAGVVTTLAVGVGVLVGAIKLWKIATTAITAVQAAWTLAQTAGTAATTAFTAAKTAGLTSTTALAAATSAGSAATVTNTAATTANTVVQKAWAVAAKASGAWSFVTAIAGRTTAWIANTAATVANTAASVASKAAMLAVRGAMAVATAAQWAWNAALTANPIGIIIGLIAALVAGIIWFFTQTDLGREIWANFITFLSEAWTNIVAVATTVWNALAAFFTDLWNGIVTGVQTVWTGFTGWITASVEAVAAWWNGIWSAVGSFFTGLWNGIVNLVVGYVQWYISTLMSIVGAVVTWWNNIWSAVGSFFSGLWQGIVNGVVSQVNAIRTNIMNVVNAIVSWWRATWNGVSSFFSGLWNGIVAAVQNAGRAFGSVFNGIRTAISNAFSGVVNIVKAPINAIIGLVNGAIRGLNRLSVSIPDWVPGFGGQTFGLSIPTIPHLAKGATVLPRSGGTLAVLAEAGRPESVVDTGLMNRALEQGLAGNGSEGMVVQGPLVHVEQMIVDSDERVEQVSQALQEKMQRAERASGKVNLGGAVVE